MNRQLFMLALIICHVTIIKKKFGKVKSFLINYVLMASGSIV